MGLEAGTYINSLNASNPVGASDPKSQGDDHLRLIKSTIKNTFPNITGAVTLTHTQLNAAWHTGNLTVTAAGQALIDDAAASNQRTTLGLGSIATVNSPVPIANGGTASTTAAAARTALGLGSLATQNTINNSDWSGTALAVANGGTGATTAAGARTNLAAANSALVITAGDGLTGGGDLNGNFTIDMGTPGTLTSATGNTTGASTHFHELDCSSIVAEGIVDIGEGSMGAYAMLKYDIDTDRAHGFTTSGDNLVWSNANGGGSDGLAGSTWRLHGQIIAGSIAGRTSLWAKIT